MFAVVNRQAVEAVVIRGVTKRQVDSIVQYLHSEFQTTVSVKQLGWGKDRRYELGAGYISQAARRYLGQYQQPLFLAESHSPLSGPRSSHKAEAMALSSQAHIRR